MLSTECMEHYVTIFDRAFVPQGLALHESLMQHADTCCLWVLCVDDGCYFLLLELRLKNVRLLRLSLLETPELLRVKPQRSRAEYCWTLTPFAPRFIFEADPGVARVTYLDADLFFLKSPKPIHDEFDRSGKGVLITEHGFASRYDQTASSGRFCVQFMTFDRVKGHEVLQWWQARCIEWCFARYEGGKFGDQKYLDCWPALFEQAVSIMPDAQRAMAPWNAVCADADRAIFYHFHGLRLLNGGLVSCAPSTYELPQHVLSAIYVPYLKALRRARKVLRRARKPWAPQGQVEGRKLFIKTWLAGYVWHLRMPPSRLGSQIYGSVGLELKSIFATIIR